MKRYIILLIYLIISIFELNAYNINQYEEPYTPTYNYIPFKSANSNILNTNYNTVKPLNIDGTVSNDYTTYKNVCRPRRNNHGNLDVEDEDDPIGSNTPIGDPDIDVIIFLVLIFLLYRKFLKYIF